MPNESPPRLRTTMPAVPLCRLTAYLSKYLKLAPGELSDTRTLRWHCPDGASLAQNPVDE